MQFNAKSSFVLLQILLKTRIKVSANKAKLITRDTVEHNSLLFVCMLTHYYYYYQRHPAPLQRQQHTPLYCCRIHTTLTTLDSSIHLRANATFYNIKHQALPRTIDFCTCACTLTQSRAHGVIMQFATLCSYAHNFRRDSGST